MHLHRILQKIRLQHSDDSCSHTLCGYMIHDPQYDSFQSDFLCSYEERSVNAFNIFPQLDDNFSSVSENFRINKKTLNTSYISALCLFLRLEWLHDKWSVPMTPSNSLWKSNHRTCRHPSPAKPQGTSDEGILPFKTFAIFVRPQIPLCIALCCLF